MEDFPWKVFAYKIHLFCSLKKSPEVFHQLVIVHISAMLFECRYK